MLKCCTSGFQVRPLIIQQAFVGNCLNPSANEVLIDGLGAARTSVDGECFQDATSDESPVCRVRAL
jgi:hypothetical protein